MTDVVMKRIILGVDEQRRNHDAFQILPRAGAAVIIVSAGEAVQRRGDVFVKIGKF